MNEKMSKKEKVKAFVNEHSEMIAIVMTSAMCGAAYGLGYKHGDKHACEVINNGLHKLSLVEPEFNTIFERGCKTLGCKNYK